MASNIEATKKGYEAFQRGDIPSLMKDLLHDDCTWIAPGPKDKLPWAGTFRGQDDPPGNRTILSRESKQAMRFYTGCFESGHSVAAQYLSLWATKRHFA